MRILLLDAYDRADPDSAVAAAAVEALSYRGHEVDVLSLAEFNPYMSPAEHAAYHSDEPIISEDVRASVARLRQANGLLFCYPTITFTVPARLKGWLERVMVPGVGFVFDRNHRVKRGMTNIRRIGAVTTSPHGRMARMRARDGGKRTTVRTMRLSCHTRCRVTFVSLPAGTAGSAEASAGTARIQRALRNW